MKRIFQCLATGWLLMACSAAPGPGLPTDSDILQRIAAPEFPDVSYDIRDFGARADGEIDSRQAINEAITQCSTRGGGRVVVPAGQYLCKGPILLKSRVNLHLEAGAEILFSPDPHDYLPAVLTIWEGTELYNYSPLVYAYHVSDIAITGQGTLNGQASQGFARFRPQRSEMQDSLRQMGIDQVPVRERCFGERSILPPSMIQPFGCRNILIEGVTILDSPYWVIHPVFCDNVTVREVTISSHNLNNDGCDPEYTTNVLIERCVFDVGDDAVAIKAGRDQDAWRIGQPTRNILIRDCEFKSKCNGLCIGSEMSAGVENVRMERVRISRCLSGIYFKSNLDRGGFIRNVHVSDVVCDTVRTAFIRFETNYHGARGGFHPTAFENFRIERVRGTSSSECGFYAVGTPGHNLRQITLEDVELRSAPTPYVLKHTENVSFHKVRINGTLMPEQPAQTESSTLKSY